MVQVEMQFLLTNVDGCMNVNVCFAQNNVKALLEKLGHFGVQQTYSLF